MAASDSLSDTLVQFWRNNSGTKAVCPQIWFNEVPEYDENDKEVVLPFTRLLVEKEEPIWNTEGQYHSASQVVFEVYANGGQVVESIVEAAKSALDWVPGLGFQTSFTVQVMLDRVEFMQEQMRDRNAQTVAGARMFYQVMRTRAQGT